MKLFVPNFLQLRREAEEKSWAFVLFILFKKYEIEKNSSRLSKTELYFINYDLRIIMWGDKGEGKEKKRKKKKSFLFLVLKTPIEVGIINIHKSTQYK